MMRRMTIPSTRADRASSGYAGGGHIKQLPCMTVGATGIGSPVSAGGRVPQPAGGGAEACPSVAARTSRSDAGAVGGKDVVAGVLRGKNPCSLDRSVISAVRLDRRLAICCVLVDDV